MDTNDQALLIALKNDNIRAFEALYQTHAIPLLRYTSLFTKDKEASENIVQEIFTAVWVRRKELDINESFEKYLKGAAKFKILSHIRSEKTHQKYVAHFNIFLAQYDNNEIEDATHLSELKFIIETELKSLPPKCHYAFSLSRFENRTIEEIALEMNISKRTVENYITQALKHLRKALKDYVWILLLIDINTHF